MGIFFNSPKPRVTQEEWKRVRATLLNKYYFTLREVNQIEEIFRGDMDEQKMLEKGIDTIELVKGIQWMRQHLNTHRISAKKIDAVEVEMMKWIDPSKHASTGIF